VQQNAEIGPASAIASYRGRAAPLLRGLARVGGYGCYSRWRETVVLLASLLCFGNADTADWVLVNRSADGTVELFVESVTPEGVLSFEMKFICARKQP
jgi:hypothetical protein